MLLHCAPSCFSCDKLIFEERCPIESDYPAAWNPGDLNKMFERITTEPYYQKYAPTILSRPLNDESGSNNPWLVQLDNFLSEKECKQMILLGSEQGYKRSEDVGPKKFDGTYDGTKSEGRTSSNAWCLDSCYANATTRTVLERIENLTGIPDQNSEYLQILRYEETQFYQSHHDFIPHHVNRVQGK
jgi:prolyl 4-hydroxylase